MKKIELISFTDEHVSKTFDWIKSQELRRMFLMRGEISRDSHEKYFEKVLNDKSQNVFAVLVERRHVGNCGFKNLSFSAKEGELWIYIGEKNMRGAGVGKTATKMLISKGFKSLKLQMIYLHVADFNIAARNLYKRLGFVETQIKENIVEWSNRGCEIIRMELSKKQWMSR